MKLSILAVAVVSLVSAGLATAVGSHLRGTVEYSFDDRYRLVRANNFIYQVDADAIPQEERQSLAKVGSRISMNFPPGAIVRAWPAVGEAGPDFALPVAPDAIAIAPGGLQLTGTVIPTPSADNYYIQIGATIFRIQPSELAQSERSKFESSSGRLVVQVPASAIRFAWNAPSATEGGRLPAATVSERPDHYSVRGKMIEVTGLVLTSYDDSSIQVQSGDTFFKINRAALGKESLWKETYPNGHVSVVIPAKNVSLVWVQNNALVPEELVRAIGTRGR